MLCAASILRLLDRARRCLLQHSQKKKCFVECHFLDNSISHVLTSRNYIAVWTHIWVEPRFDPDCESGLRGPCERGARGHNTYITHLQCDHRTLTLWHILWNISLGDFGGRSSSSILNRDRPMAQGAWHFGHFLHRMWMRSWHPLQTLWGLLPVRKIW